MEKISWLCTLHIYTGCLKTDQTQWLVFEKLSVVERRSWLCLWSASLPLVTALFRCLRPPFPPCCPPPPFAPASSKPALKASCRANSSHLHLIHLSNSPQEQRNNLLTSHQSPSLTISLSQDDADQYEKMPAPTKRAKLESGSGDPVAAYMKAVNQAKAKASLNWPWPAKPGVPSFPGLPPHSYPGPPPPPHTGEQSYDF